MGTVVGTASLARDDEAQDDAAMAAPVEEEETALSVASDDEAEVGLSANGATTPHSCRGVRPEAGREESGGERDGGADCCRGGLRSRVSTWAGRHPEAGRDGIGSVSMPMPLSAVARCRCLTTSLRCRCEA